MSPDGRSFVYQVEEGLYLRSMDDLSRGSCPEPEETLSSQSLVPVSPDGQWIWLLRRAAGQLKRIAVTGGAPVTVSAARTALSVRAGRRDNTILFGQGRAGIMRVSAERRCSRAPDSGRRRRIDVRPATACLTETPSCSASRRRAPALGRRTNRRAIVVVRQRTVLVEGGSDARYLSKRTSRLWVQDAYSASHSMRTSDDDRRGSAARPGHSAAVGVSAAARNYAESRTMARSCISPDGAVWLARLGGPQWHC